MSVVGQSAGKTSEEERKTMDPQSYDYIRRLKGRDLHYFLAGFTDGEGSFNVSFSRHPDLRSKWIINLKFQVYQHADNIQILEIFKRVFQTGSIRKKSGSNVYVFSIESKPSLQEKVIPFFSKYRLAVKDKDFRIFKVILDLLVRKEHLHPLGFQKILSLAYAMNQQGKQRQRTEQEILDSMLESLISSEESSETIRQNPIEEPDKI